MFTRTTIDIYHGDTVDLPLMANNGVQAVMMKATQGVNYVDPTFASRMAEAVSLGLAVGSYHFGTGEDPIVQVHHWLDIARPKPGDAMEFDWEENPSGASMTYDQACAFVREVFQKTGRFPLLYGSNYLFEKIPASGDSILFSCPLSLAAYNSKPKIPRGWKNYTLWQYTGDGAGPFSPHTFPGAANALDVYQFDGTIKELREKWPFVVTQQAPPIPAPIPVPQPPIVPKPTQKYGIYSESSLITRANVGDIRDACHAQAIGELKDIWGKRVIVEPFDGQSSVPIGYYPVIIKDDIGAPGALGYHTDRNNQPICFIKAQDLDNTCIGCSHEILEAAVDSFGNRFITIDLPPYGNVRVLVEIADPPEAFAYADHGLPVSDFITPEWYDEIAQAGVRYSYKRHIRTPQSLAEGGYFSFMLADGTWMQRTWFSGDAPIDEGPFNWKLNPGEALREMVDRETGARRMKGGANG